MCSFSDSLTCSNHCPITIEQSIRELNQRLTGMYSRICEMRLGRNCAKQRKGTTLLCAKNPRKVWRQLNSALGRKHCSKIARLKGEGSTLITNTEVQSIELLVTLAVYNIWLRLTLHPRSLDRSSLLFILKQYLRRRLSKHCALLMRQRPLDQMGFLLDCFEW